MIGKIGDYMSEQIKREILTLKKKTEPAPDAELKKPPAPPKTKSIADLTKELANKNCSARDKLNKIIAASNLLKAQNQAEVRLKARVDLLARCKKEVGDLLVKMMDSKQLTDEVADAIISRYDLSSLTNHIKPKPVSSKWLRMQVAKWKKETETSSHPT